MRITGIRADGALFLTLGGGLACLLRGDCISPPVDDARVLALGPWGAPPAEDNTWSARQQVQKRADRARVVSLTTFTLGLSYDEQRNRVQAALRSHLGYGDGNGYGSYPSPVGGPYIPMNGLGADWVVYCIGEQHYGVVYSITDAGRVVFEGLPVKVATTWESLEDIAEDQTETAPEPTGFDEAVNASYALRRSPWFKKFMASKTRA